MIEKKIRPIWPIYAAGGVWILCGLVLPLYTLWAILVTAILSLAVYGLSMKLAPSKTILVPDPSPSYHTGEEEVDALLGTARKDLDSLHLLNDIIEDPSLSSQIERMEKAGNAILEEIQKNPAKGLRIRKFFVYYLPTAVKVLTSYAKFSRQSSAGANAKELMAQVESNAATIATAFEHQLDSLYTAEVLDISADIDVLKAMAQSESLPGMEVGHETSAK